MTLRPVREALEELLAAFQPLEAESVSLMQSLGRVLAQPIRVPMDFPPLPTSSMDGFAVRAVDVRDASPERPVRLRVVADVPAGTYVETPVQAGEAARIMTGAPLPPGADAVVPVEETDFGVRDPGAPLPAQVRVLRAVRRGNAVRQVGEDMRRGQEVLAPGRVLRPQELGLLGMLGLGEVAVYRRPRVALLSSGDELLPAGSPWRPGKIYDANTYTLHALAERCGAEVIPLGVAADDAGDVQQRLDRAVDAGADLILSSAGVSVGAFDFVRAVVERYGRLDFWRVNMRPGKPVAFGAYRGVPFLGLPGNPVSAFVTFEIFARPVLFKMQGRTDWERPRRVARLAEAVTSDGRESYLRAVVTPDADGRLVARLTGHQGSGNLLSLVQANALLIVPAGVKSLPEGSEAAFWYLD